MRLLRLQYIRFQLQDKAWTSFEARLRRTPRDEKLKEDYAMDEITREPIRITAEDINPRYNWGRHLPVLGTMGVDFEERVDYRRMHRYRLGRAQVALEASELGALL